MTKKAQINKDGRCLIYDEKGSKYVLPVLFEPNRSKFALKGIFIQIPKDTVLKVGPGQLVIRPPK